MTAEFPKMLYAPTGKGSATVHDVAEEARHLDLGYSVRPRAIHHEPQVLHAPEPAATEPLTAAHIPAIVDAVFERLRSMAQAAAAEPAAREAAEGVEALRADLDERFGALKGDLLGSISALIAPAPAPATGPAGKKA